MKIIQSFWSKPFFKEKKEHIHDRKFGGFNEKKYFYYSWTLSCLQLCKYYKNVNLVTDAIGKKLLVDTLELPYVHVSTDLDDLQSFDQDFWALGKIMVYSSQDQPFIHVDGDAFIWKKFPPFIETAGLVAQSYERQFNVFARMVHEIKEDFPNLPAYFFTVEEENMHNAGIIGGNDYKFFKELAKEVFGFIGSNAEEIQHVDKNMFNAIFEQYIYFKYAEATSRKVTHLLEDIDYQYHKVCDFTKINKEHTFTHMLGKFKNYEHINKQLEVTFRKMYPEYYQKINVLLMNTVL